MRQLTPVKSNDGFSRGEWQEIAEIANASTCGLLVFLGKEGLLGVHISFTGPLAHFPSTSNGREIRWRHFRDKHGQKRTVPYNGRSKSQLVRLKAASLRFTQTLANSGHQLPCFLDERVRITGLFAAKAGRWDVHNQIKPMCDWIQDLGIINDDANARANAERKDDWKDKFPDWETTTTIIIQPEKGIRSLIGETIHEMRLVSSGALQLVG